MIDYLTKLNIKPDESAEQLTSLSYVSIHKRSARSSIIWENNTMNKIKYYELKSVGCHINEKGYTYPTLKDGEIDLSNPFHIEDIEENEWFNTLSKKDKAIVETIISILIKKRALNNLNTR